MDTAVLMLRTNLSNTFQRFVRQLVPQNGVAKKSRCFVRGKSTAFYRRFDRHFRFRKRKLLIARRSPLHFNPLSNEPYSRRETTKTFEI